MSLGSSWFQLSIWFLVIQHATCQSPISSHHSKVLEYICSSYHISQQISLLCHDFHLDSFANNLMVITPTREKTLTLQSLCARQSEWYHKDKNLPRFRKDDISEIGPIIRHNEFIPQSGRNFTNCLEIWVSERNIYSTLISKCCKVFAI